MSAIGSGYDLSVGTYSRDGRVYQVEYAHKAVENAGTLVGARVKDGVVLGVEKLILSKMMEPGSNRQVTAIDLHVGVASTGLSADARQLSNYAHDEAHSYRKFYGAPVPINVVAKRLASVAHNYTLHSYMRPFGATAIIGGVDVDGPQLWLVEPSGITNGYFATAVGKGARAAKSELEKLKLNEMTMEQLVKELTRILYYAHDDAKDQEKPFTVELSWCGTATGNKFKSVPKELYDAATAGAVSALAARDTGDDDDMDK